MEVDQGIGYELAGLVARLEVLDPLTAVHPAARVVSLDAAGLGLLPLSGTLASTLTPAMICTVSPVALAWGPESTGRPGAAALLGLESGFHRLTAGSLALIEAGSVAGPIGYLEADYQGRDGRQAAAVWDAGRVVLGPLLLGRTEPFGPGVAPITAALRMLGVVATGRKDEFVVAGLGRHRRTGEWM